MRSPGLLALCALAMVASFLIVAASPDASAQTANPTCTANAVFNNGPYWGWENNATCENRNNLPTGGEVDCVDSAPTGDGWGWDGTASCRVAGCWTGDTNTCQDGGGPAEPVTPDCVDSAPTGDGWGWDGTASCRVAGCWTGDTNTCQDGGGSENNDGELLANPGGDTTPACLESQTNPCFVRVANRTTATDLNSSIVEIGTHEEPDRDSGGLRIRCAVSHFAYDDAVKFPGEFGAAHLHMFFGNTSVNAESKNDLNTEGADTNHIMHTSNRSTSCSDLGKYNHSAYWMPALFNKDNEVVMPYDINVYYKTLSNGTLYQDTDGDGVVEELEGLQDVPNDLKMVGKKGNIKFQPSGINGRDVLTATIEFKNCIVPRPDGGSGAYPNDDLKKSGTDRNENYEMKKTNSTELCMGTGEFRIPTVEFNISWLVDGSTKLNEGKWSFSDGSHYDSGVPDKWLPAASDGVIPLPGLHGDYMAAWSDRMDEVVTCNKAGSSCRLGGYDRNVEKIKTAPGMTIAAGQTILPDNYLAFANAAVPELTGWRGMPPMDMDMGDGGTPMPKASPPPPPPPPVTPPTNDEVRTAAMTEIVGALEAYAIANGTFNVAGGGSKGNGQGWFHYDGNVNYTTAVSTVLADAGYLDDNDLPLGPLHRDGTVVDDFVVYRCQDFIGVFSRGIRDSRAASPADQATWADPDNSCTAYPTGRFGSTYYMVSRPLSELRDQVRTAAMTEIVDALEAYASDNGTYKVTGGGWGGAGQGWYHYDANDKYPASVNSVLTGAGYLDAGDPPFGPLHRDDTVVDDFLLYRCKDFIGVFSRRDTRAASSADQDAWTDNGCTTRPTVTLGSTYYMVATPRAELSGPPSPAVPFDVKLINSSTNAVVGTVTNGSSLSRSGASNLNFQVEPDQQGVGSVKLTLSGATSGARTENVAPYTLFGDSGGNYFNGPSNAGSHTLRVQVYSSSGANGTLLSDDTISFTLT